jgi:hypothetical protein
MSYPKVIIEMSNDCCTCNKSLIKIPAAGGCGCQTVQLPCSTSTPNSPCTDCEDECVDAWLLSCGIYDLGDIPQLGIKENDKMAKVIITLSAQIIVLKQQAADFEARIAALEA